MNHSLLLKHLIDKKLRLSYAEHEELLYLVYKNFLKTQLKLNKHVTAIDVGAHKGFHSDQIKNIINKESKLLCLNQFLNFTNPSRNDT